MTIDKLASIRSVSEEPPRSTAYYYGDLERLKRTHDDCLDRANPDELSEYVESNEISNDGPIKEVPPLRDRPLRQWSLPECEISRKFPEHTPEGVRKEETYSTAGTFPMPQQKEKEPLLAELEVVGRLPLSQLETGSGVRRSRSWYLCCPNMADEEASRESSWRYSSLRPVTAPPLPGRNGLMVATQSSGPVEDVTTLRAERDALARALATERQRAATVARAHDARLAELHGVIAELVRRRAEKQSKAILEEVSDECESSTQPAGDADCEAERSRTDCNDASSAFTPPQPPPPPEDASETSASEQRLYAAQDPVVEVTSSAQHAESSTSVDISDRYSELCLNTARCCQHARAHSAGSADRQRGSASDGGGAGGDLHAYTGRCESRETKVACRVRLKRTEEYDTSSYFSNEEAWWGEPAPEESEAGEAMTAVLCAWRARCARLAAERRVLRCALARATDTAHRLASACGAHESSTGALCAALRAADRALETYDVLLALAESAPGAERAEGAEGAEGGAGRAAAESVAGRLLARLDAECAQPWAAPADMSPGPWLDHYRRASVPEQAAEAEAEVGAGAGAEGGAWSAAREARLRRHAARLKGDTVALRALRAPPALLARHDIDEDEMPKCVGDGSMAEMEAAVMMQEVVCAREARAAREAREARQARAARRAAAGAPGPQSNSVRGKRRQRHWLETQPSETDL